MNLEFFKDIEFTNDFHIVEALKASMNKHLTIVDHGAYKCSGKYLFEGWIVVKDDSGVCYKIDTEMFGNNPRDDYHYIKVINFNKVKKVEVTTYEWEVVK